MSAFAKLLEPQTETVVFHGEDVQIRKLPMLVILEIMEAAKASETSNSFRENADTLALIISNGVVGGEGSEQMILTADSDLYMDISELSNSIMEFSGLKVKDVEDEVDG